MTAQTGSYDSRKPRIWGRWGHPWKDCW